MCKDGCLSSIEEVSLLPQCGSVTLFKSRGNLDAREFAFRSDSAHHENIRNIQLPHEFGNERAIERVSAAERASEASCAEQVNE